MGEHENTPFQFTFTGTLKVASQRSRVTSDTGIMPVGEFDDRLGLWAVITEHLRDSRDGLNTHFRLPERLRQSASSCLADYENLNDAARLSDDPTFRPIGLPTRWDRGAALTSRLHWFETKLLPHEENLVGLMAVNRELIGQDETFTRSDCVVPDMDSCESPVHGPPDGRAHNGNFASVCDHPRFPINERSDCVAAMSPSGNVHSADDWDEWLAPECESRLPQTRMRRRSYR